MTEKEMLLLSNYVYMDISTDEMSIGDSIDRFRNEEGSFDENSVSEIVSGGGLSRKETADILKRMDEMPDDFKKLYPSKILNDDEVRGICYTKGKSDTGSGCVVFRGTGGTYEAWNDNVLGQCMTDTKIQMKAADWVDRECCFYNDLQVCGHSKGGNLAMYATALCTAAVSSCVSFDGQGFSEDFINAYPDEIKASSGKIKSISAYNDFVNVLLYSIAGTNVYTENQGTGVNAHSSYYMLISNEYDEDGRIVSLRKQSVLSRALDEFTDGVAKRLNMLPGNGNSDFTGLLASLVAGIIGSDESYKYKMERILDSTGDVGEYLLSVNSENAFPTHMAIKLSTMTNETMYDKLERTGSEIGDLGNRISRICTELDDFTYGMTNNRIDCYIKPRMDVIKERLMKNVRNIYDYSTILKDISRKYAGNEAKICDIVSC